jgi:hypothetical protein
MSTYKIRILLNSGTTGWFSEEIITDVKLASASGNNYQFYDDKNRWKYYPVAYTIVEQIDDTTPEKITLEI